VRFEHQAPRITVIVPVRNDREGVCQLLRRLETQTVPQDEFEIIISDDGSAPGSLSGLATTDSRVRVLSGPPKTSYAARNRAARAANGELLAFCDADCLPEATWLERGLEALADSDLVAGNVIFTRPARVSVWSLLTMDMFLDQERDVRLSRAVTANLFLRKSVFEAAGGFDESLPSGGDHDFTRRAVSRGARLVYAPGAIVRHPTLDSARSLLRKVWFTNRWLGVRNSRSGIRPTLTTLLVLVPVLGAALMRRKALRPRMGLGRARLAASGITAGRREDAQAIPILYFVVAPVAGIALARGWLDVRLNPQRRRAPIFTTGRALPLNAIVRRRARSIQQAGLPNLVVIGAQKCGTSSLHSYLDLHPEISMSRRKEINFFIKERNWERGIDWYRQHFDPEAPVSGESSPNYSAFPHFDGVPERMASLIPDARLVFLVRDPLDRIASHWLHNYAQRRERGDLQTTLLDPDDSYITRSCYDLQIQQFLRYFHASQILVLDSDDLRHRRLYALRRVFEFAGVDPDFYHPGFEQLHHSSDLKRRATPVGLQARRLVRPLVRRGPAVTIWRGIERVLSMSHPIETRPDVRLAVGNTVLTQLREDAERFRTRTGAVIGHWSIFGPMVGTKQ